MGLLLPVINSRLANSCLVAKYTQGAGLDGSVMKKEVATPEVKTNGIDDTAGFMEAVRARLCKPDPKKTVTASNEIGGFAFTFDWFRAC